MEFRSHGEHDYDNRLLVRLKLYSRQRLLYNFTMLNGWLSLPLRMREGRAIVPLKLLEQEMTKSHVKSTCLTYV